MKKEMMKMSMHKSSRNDVHYPAGQVVYQPKALEQEIEEYKQSLKNCRCNDECARVLVALDNPKAWSLVYDKQPHPYMMGNDFLPEMAEPRKVADAPFVPDLRRPSETRRGGPMSWLKRLNAWCEKYLKSNKKNTNCQ
jgi:hypothetical protein